MKYPKLRKRPSAIMTCTNFRGLDRRPGASSRSYNKTWHWAWHNEQNLSADRFPRLSVRKGRATAEHIDGNDPADEIIAMCGGDHVVLLDRAGGLWCNGHQVPVYDTYGERNVSWRIECDDAGPYTNITVTPASGSTYGTTALGGLVDRDHAGIVRFRIVQSFVQWVFGGATEVSRTFTATWETDASGTWTPADPADYGITFDSDQWLAPGWTMRVKFKVDRFSGNVQILRMGANVVIKDGSELVSWANAVKLAAGETMTEGTDYGPIGCWAKTVQTGGETITLTLCDIDGNAFSGVAVSAAEPTQEGYWLDISSDSPALREWSVSQAAWIHISGTYVKVSGLSLADYHHVYSTPISAGDAVEITADLADGTDAGVVSLLNSSHYIYGAGSDYIILGGTLPSDTVTLTDGDIVRIDRHPPTLDFVVEAANRLWGCRYDEANSINEIYASKLGDFYNWSAFQGLSTDSWTASRGRAAPFTGAAVLGDNPLFFREDSVEKVFPSASGAHGIVTYSLEGVQMGSADSMVVIDELLYYKSRMGVCVYNGTLPMMISEEFGEWMFQDATAARHLRKYAVCMTRSDGERVCMVYDLNTRDWHVESKPWEGAAITWGDVLHYIKDGQIYAMDGADGAQGVKWSAESDELSLELPSHKWVTCLRLRYVLEWGASCRVYISYDGGPWERKTALNGNTTHSAETAIWPRRCDHFRLRLEGVGGFELQSVSYRLEQSQGGH